MYLSRIVSLFHDKQKWYYQSKFGSLQKSLFEISFDEIN